MKLEYRIWNIKPEWTPLKSTTISGAQDELEAMGPYAEEAQIKDVETGDIYKRRPDPPIDFGPF